MIYLLFFIIAGGLFFTLTKTGQGLAANIGETVSEQAKNISDYAVSLVAGFEGFSAVPYQDEAGYWTWGFGHKQQSGESLPVKITVDEGRAILAQDMAQAASVVDQYVNVSISENQRSALISFVFNTSSNDPERFANSTLLRKLNAGDAQGAADEFDKWVHAGGKVSNGLVARREAEKELFLT